MSAATLMLEMSNLHDAKLADVHVKLEAILSRFQTVLDRILLKIDKLINLLEC